MVKSVNTQYNQLANVYIASQKGFYTKYKSFSREIIQEWAGNLKGKTVLDVGCGDGHDLLTYRQMGSKKLFGIDPSQEMVALAKETVGRHATIKKCSVESTPFRARQFDIIIGRYSLHYVPSIDKAYKEMNRILKPGGAMIMVVPHPIRDLEIQKSKNYGEKELIKAQLYYNDPTMEPIYVTFHSHTFSDYFSKIFFKYFVIDQFVESSPRSQGYFSVVFKAIKRSQK